MYSLDNRRKVSVNEWSLVLGSSNECRDVKEYVLVGWKNHSEEQEESCLKTKKFVKGLHYGERFPKVIT